MHGRPALLEQLRLRVRQLRRRHLPVTEIERPRRLDRNSGMKRRRQAAEREPVRRMLLPALMTLALASSAWAQTPQDAPRDPTAIKADLERIKADLEAVKSQLGQLLRPAEPASSPGRHRHQRARAYERGRRTGSGTRRRPGDPRRVLRLPVPVLPAVFRDNTPH